MTPEQRDQYIEAVMQHLRGYIEDVDAAVIVDQIIRPALAFAWEAGHRAHTSKNPYLVVAWLFTRALLTALS